MRRILFVDNENEKMLSTQERKRERESWARLIRYESIFCFKKIWDG